MKKSKFSLSILLFLLIGIGVQTLASCSSDDDKDEYKGNPFQGTWLSKEGYVAIFEDSTWYIPEYTNKHGIKGTYTYVNFSAQIIYTEITEDGIIWREITSVEASKFTRIATVSKNTLTWGTTSYTRQN